MRGKLLKAGMLLTVFLPSSGPMLAQAAQQNATLLVSGQPGQAPVVQINGRSYVDVEALARLINGSLSFKGNQITLTLPASAPPARPHPTRRASRQILDSPKSS